MSDHSDVTENALLVFDDLTLDSHRRLLTNDTAVCKLRPQECLLLEFFMRHPNTILSRAQIMKQVWNTDYLGDTRTLYTHICWLRQKIEKDPHHPQRLRTIRGVGYRFGS